MTRASYCPPILAYRRRGAYYLRRARWLATPAPMGRPKAGEVRKARPHDPARAMRSALRLARYYYATAARYVLYTKKPRHVPETVGARAPIRGG